MIKNAGFKEKIFPDQCLASFVTLDYVQASLRFKLLLLVQVVAADIVKGAFSSTYLLNCCEN